MKLDDLLKTVEGSGPDDWHKLQVQTVYGREHGVTKFPDPKAKSVAVALRYRGAVVYEWVGVTVDGGRYLLPMPDIKAGGSGHEVPKAKMKMAELFFQLYRSGGVNQSAADALKRAGIPIV